MTLIDLGEAAWDEVTPAPPVNHRRLLRAALALLTVAGLLVLAGSAHGGPPGLRPVWKIAYTDDDAMAFDRKTLYVARAEDGHAAVAAYDLATGAPRWTAPTGEAHAGRAPRVVGDTVLASADPRLTTHEDADGNKFFLQSVRTTVALDAATGDELWRTGGEVRAYAASGNVMISEDDEQGRVIRLRQVRPRDGGEIWSRPVSPLAGWTLLPDDDHPTAIATLTPDGQVTILGYADGQPRGGGRLPWRAKNSTAMLWAAGNEFAVIQDIVSGDSTTTVYDPTAFKPLWQTRWVTACGDLLCATDVNGVSGRDPVTGHEVWTIPGANDINLVAPGRLLLSSYANRDLQLVDAGTGRTVGGTFTGQFAVSADPDALFVLRPSVKPAGSSVVNRLDPADGKQTPLGSFVSSDGVPQCTATRGYLACRIGPELRVIATGLATAG
jgi:outer membrane protein assembly factor BamB